MSLIDAVVDRCLSVAVRRWPAELRTEHATEWRAEMHAINEDTTLTAMTRAARRLRFAFSLAASPPVEDDNGVPRGWREYVPATGRALWPALLLFALGLACRYLALVSPALGDAVGGLAGGGGYGTYAATPGQVWVRVGIAAGCTLPVIAGAGLAAHALARRFPLVPAPAGAAGRAASVVLAVLLVGAGTVTGTLLWGAGDDLIWYAALLWAATAALVSLGAVLIARGGLPRLARVLALAGGLALLDLVAVELGTRNAVGGVDTAIALLWFPLSPGAEPYLMTANNQLELVGSVNPDILGGLNFTMTTYLFALVVVVAYTVRAATAGRPVRAPRPGAAPGTALVGERARLAALACSGVALVLWAYAVAFTRGETRFDPYVRTWAFDVRHALLLLGLAALAFALNGRGRPLPFAVAGGAVLVAADALLAANRVTGPAAFAIAVAAGIAVYAGIRWATPVLGGPHSDEGASRRGLTAIALTSAYLAPVVYATVALPYSYGSTDVPIALPLETAAVSALLAAFGMAAALAGRRSPLSTAASALLVAVPAAVMAALGVLLAVAPGPWPLFVPALAVPLALVALAVVRGGSRRGPVLGSLVWTAKTVLGAAAAAPLFLAGMLLGGFARPLVDVGDGASDGRSYLWGMLLCVLPFIALAARRIAPPPPPEPGAVAKPRPVPTGELGTA